MRPGHLITSLLLRPNHPAPWSRAEIEMELNDISPWEINDTLAELEHIGVVILNGELVEASRCTQYLASLGTICI